MKELKRKYQEAKAKAAELMQAGSISEYIAQLYQVDQIKLQLMNVTVQKSL